MKKMKIGYLIRVRPDLEDIIPGDVDGVRIQVGDDGLYSDEDLAKVADADAFVKVGSSVSEGEVVCLIEAMKIFNEIKSETSGTVQKILVSNGDAVEFGQDLFLVKPS